jgi:hypothetical protein
MYAPCDNSGMATLLTRPSFLARCAALLTAVTLVLPLPARCANCTTASTDCPHCAAAKLEAQPHSDSTRPCCVRNAADQKNIATCTYHQIEARACDCSVHPVERVIVSSEQKATLHELLTAFSSIAPVLSDSTDSLLHSIPAFASLPPPVPHRILHCSWVI